MRKLVAGLLLALVAAAWLGTPRAEQPAPSPAQTTTLILVRHAEKEPGGPDPALTQAGQVRALELARALADVEIDTVFATQYRRTRDTARMIAESQGLEVTIDPAGGQDLASYARDFVGRVLDRHAGETIVVVGHSNTVPAFIGALGAATVPVIDEQTYDDLFVVTLSPGGDRRVLHLHYGEPSRKTTADD